MLEGNRSSSTRTELAAGCLALAAEGPIHQATDSMAYQKMATKIINSDWTRRRRPWGITKDGDLWQQFEKLVEAKGAKAIRITWIKGHAQAKHIEQGTTTWQHKEGNDLADSLAERAVVQDNDDALHLAGYYRAKQDNLQKLVQKIHDMFLRVLKEDRRLREIKEKGQRAQRWVETGVSRPTTKIQKDHSFPDLEQGVIIKMRPLENQKSFENNVTGLAMYAQVHDFFKHSIWKPTSEGANGSSWVEMLARFHQLGGRIKSKEDPITSFAKPLSLKQQMDIFRRVAKSIINIYIEPEEQYMFKAAKVIQQRLKHYGVNRHVPCISAEICLKNEQANELHKALISTKIELNRVNLDSLSKGTLRVLDGPIKMRAIPPWQAQGEEGY